MFTFATITTRKMRKAITVAAAADCGRTWFNRGVDNTTTGANGAEGSGS